jgi:TPP-dependent indolepyruvate ferredoxin oxidoreductase alpha subunit
MLFSEGCEINDRQKLLSIDPCNKRNRKEEGKQVMSQDSFHPSRRKFIAVSSAALLAPVVAPVVLHATGTTPSAKTEAGKAHASKTTPHTSKIYYVTDQCIGCHVCKVNCPVQAIFYGDRRMAIDQEKCIHCGTCYEGCPICVISEVNV